MGSFRWIAELFELDVQAVRKRLFSGARIALDTAFEEPVPAVAAILDDVVIDEAEGMDLGPALVASQVVEPMVAAA